MARFMTLPFKWNKKDYTAYVTLKPMVNDIHYTIVFNDAALYEVIPEGELCFRGSEGYHLLEQHSSAASQELINTVVTELLLKYT